MGLYGCGYRQDAVRRTEDRTRRFICLVFLRGIRERAGDTWYPYRHHHLIEAKQSDETNKREGMRAPFSPFALVVSPLPVTHRAVRASSRLHPPRRSGHSACSYKPPSLPVATFALPRILLFRSRKIEYLCKLNGRRDRRTTANRRRWEERDNHMVRVNLGNNQAGGSNLAKNFRTGQRKRRSRGGRWLIKPSRID